MALKALRVVGIASLAVIAVVVLLAAVAHVPSVQHSLAEYAVAKVRQASGVQIEAPDVRVRLLPGLAVISGLEVRDPQERWVVSIDRLEARWAWRHMLGAPYRLRSIVLEGVRIDAPGPFAGAGERTSTETGTEMFGILEIDELSLRDGVAWAAMPDLEFSMGQVRLEGRVDAQEAALRLEAGALQLERSARRLHLGPAELEISASPDRLLLQHLRIGGSQASVEAKAELGPPTSPGDRVDAELAVELDLSEIARFWDPSIVAKATPAGRLELAGWVRRRGPEFPFQLDLEHRGRPLAVGGVPIDDMTLSGAVDDLKVTASAAAWGSLSVRAHPSLLEVSARFDHADVSNVAEHLPPPVADPAGRLSITGIVNLELPVPLAVDQTTGRADLVVEGPDLRVEVRADGSLGAIEVEHLTARLPGIDAEGSGGFRGYEDIDFELTTVIGDPQRAVESIRRWWQLPDEVHVAGGPLEVEARWTGSVHDPHLEGTAVWQEPAIGGRLVDRLSTRVEGRASDLEWNVELVGAGSVARAKGTANVLKRQAEGSYVVDVVELATAARWLGSTLEVSGHVVSQGSFAVTPSRWTVANMVRGEDLAVKDLKIDKLEGAGVLVDDDLVVERLEVEAWGGRVLGRGRIAGTGTRAELDASFEFLDVDPSPVLPEGRQMPAGRFSGTAELGGSIAQPIGSADFEWVVAEGELSPVERVRLAASLADGRVELASGLVQLAGGDLSLRGSLPLGDIERPAWLWPGAPGGSARFSVAGDQLTSAPLVEALGHDPLPVRLSTDVRVDGRWDFSDPGARRVELQLIGLSLGSDLESLRADRPVVVALDGETVSLRAFRLVGERSDLGLGGSVDLGTGNVTAAGAGRFDPDLLNSLGLPVLVRGPLELSLHLEGPLLSPVGGLAVRHPGGSLVMRDPPLEIAELSLDIASDGQRVEVSDGSARVNGGRVEIGGGWDPISLQGFVFELEDVTLLLPMGVLTRWDGVVAVEPVREPDMLAAVVGYLQLDGGVWDRSVDLVGLMVGPASAEEEQPLLQGVSLDLEIDGRRGVHVDNNLGRFDVGWSLLSIGGTAAHPAILGDLNLQPGGFLIVSGQELPIHRGAIRFDGEAGSEPQIELSHGGGSGGNLDLAALAGQGLLDSVSRVVGFSNSTLEPATIAVETETDPGRRFSVSRELGRMVTLFLTTDISDVQDRSSLVQLGGISKLPGLALQAFSEAGGEDGFAVIERVSWGGTVVDDGRPRIRKIRFEGEWPLGTRRLRRASGFERGQPWDPFLLFAGGVRLERELASEGFSAARVDGRVEGPPESPIIVFGCDPGPRQEILFRGDGLPRSVRRAVVARYRPPPLEDAAFADMVAFVERSLGARGYPEAVVQISGNADLIEIDVSKGRSLELHGPVFLGVPDEVGRRVARQFGAPGQLAGLLRDATRYRQLLARGFDAEGYPNAAVEGVELGLETKKRGTVLVSMDLGDPVVVSAVRIEGADPLAATDEILQDLQPGVVLRRALVERAVRRIRRHYREAGYVDVDVRWRIDRAESAEKVVEIMLEPMARTEVGAIEIDGLRHVREATVRRALGLEPGDTLVPSAVDIGAAKLAAFSPVERVTVQTRPTGSGTAVIETQVTEKPRWMVGAGLRFTSERGTQALVDLRDGNLFGRGFGLALRGRWEREEQQWLLISSLPPLPGGRISATASAGWYEGPSRVSPDTLREEEKGATLEASFAVSATTRLRTYLSYRDNRVFELDPDPFFPIDVTTVISTLGWQAIFDRLDDPFDPRTGTFASIDIGWSAPELGSDVDTLSSTVIGTLVSTPHRDWTWTQTLRLGLAHALSGELDPAVRLFAGGETSIRGFERNVIGPRIELGDQVFVVGGGALLVLNEELRVPVNEWLRVAVFVDVGQVWETWGEVGFPLAVGAGVGLRFATPIGPLWADVAWPLAENVGEGGAKYYFGIGRPF